jgi:hypothetical protein
VSYLAALGDAHQEENQWEFQGIHQEIIEAYLGFLSLCPQVLHGDGNQGEDPPKPGDQAPGWDTPGFE